jgi:uncharacterized repeat protein (TIGR03803 family)
MKLRQMILVAATALTLMQLSAQTKIKVLHNFGATGDGSIPYGPLLFDSKGNLYGVTTDGGTGQCSDYGCGTVFELNPHTNGTWAEKILHSFAASSDGAAPWGTLLLDDHGDLYGTLHGYPGFAASGIFELKSGTGGWKNNILYDAYAGPGLVFDKSGDLYGDMGSGAYKDGAIGELSPGASGWTYTDLYDYCETFCPDGTGEPAPPVWDSNGNLWGVTYEGGISQSPCKTEFGCGVIFEMTPNGDGTWTYNVMHQFASSTTDGQEPYGGLVMDSAGNFYGTTLGGGTSGYGTIFEFSNVGGVWEETVLYNFLLATCKQGCIPEGTLAIDASGNLYGTASGGRNSCAGYSCGVVFKLAPQSNGTWTYTTLYNFSETSGGMEPFHGVILDSKGNLYGVTSYFGKYNVGTAFELTP